MDTAGPTTRVSRKGAEARGVPDGGAVVIGAGRFGGRAARILAGTLSGPVVVCDGDSGALDELGSLRVERVVCDGIEFLSERASLMGADTLIVPAIPVHCAFEWIKTRTTAAKRLTVLPVPPAVHEGVPHSWVSADGSVPVSYAGFMCPDNCPEPDVCTVTGTARPEPMYRRLGRLHCPGFRSLVIRSRQLAPGVGGFTVSDLAGAMEMIADAGGPWLLATACKCHGIVTAFELK